MPCRIILLGLLIVLPLFAEPAGETLTESFALRRKRATALVQAHAPEAVPELQKLLKEQPTDAETLFQMGRALMSQGHLLDAGSSRQETMKESRYFFSRAQQAGLDEPLIATALAEINPDGTENVRRASENAEADRLFRQGEVAFTKRDFPAAQQSYLAALKIEPANYLATLYLGDALFASGAPKEAIIWYERAAALDPNRETAYRYWGDALLRLGRKDDALERYLSAVIAEPYNGYSRRSLQNCCQAMLLKPWVAAQKAPFAEVKDGAKGPEINLPKNYTTLHMAYAVSRAKWQTENKAKRFPAGVAYRQTLEEEIFSLSSLITIYGELKQAKQPVPSEIAKALADADSSIEELTEIERAGLLPAHILFFRANPDIAQDYAAYRDANRAKLRDYLIKYYLHLP